MNRANIGWNIANMIDNEHLIAGTESGVGPSPKLWSNCPYLPIMLDPTKGFVYFDDFFNGFTDLSADGWGNNLYLDITDSGTLKHKPDYPGGIIEIAAAATTVDDGALMKIPGCQVEPAENTKVWMEWRCKVNKGGGQMFMGLCDDSVAAPVSSSDAMVANDHAGFFRDSGTGDLDWSVGIGDGTTTEDSDDECTTDETAYHKYGMLMEGIGAVSGSNVTFFYDGEPIYTTTDYDDMPLLLMCPAFQAHGDDSDQPYIFMDWLRIAVYNPNTGGRES